MITVVIGINTCRVINVIFRGGSIGQSRSYTRKVMNTATKKNSKKRSYPSEEVSFSKEDLDSIVNPHEDSLVIHIEIKKT